MMNRKFTLRESVLLLFLAVLLLGLFYYFILVKPVTEEVDQCNNAYVPVEDQLTTEMMKAARKDQMLKAMEDAKEEPKGDILPYDNVSKEMHHLEASLVLADSYKLDFSDPVASGKIVRRDVNIQFDADNYARARLIITSIHESPYRSSIKDLTVVAEERRDREVELEPGLGDPVDVKMVITFYETLTGATTTEGLTYEESQPEAAAPALPEDLLYE